MKDLFLAIGIVFFSLILLNIVFDLMECLL